MSFNSIKFKAVQAALAVCLALLSWKPLTASSAPIAGEISFAGTATVDQTNLSLATRVTSFTAVTVGASPTGDYSGTTLTPVTISPFTFAPFSSPITPLWTFKKGDVTYSFDLNTSTIGIRSTRTLFLSGTGVAHMTGHEDTPGTWTYSMQGRTTFTFSASSTAVAPTGLIGDYVWSDSNRNGVQDSGEPGIDGVTVMLLDSLGNLYDQTITKNGGYYEFIQLFADTYYVVVDTASAPLAGLLPSNIGAAASDTDSNSSLLPVFLATDNSTDRTVDFGFYAPLPPSGQIGNYVWKDSNQNGVQDDGEPGIPNVTVKLLDSARNLLTSKVTGADGSYLFDKLIAGTYVIQVDTASETLHGFIPTFENAPGSSTELDSNAGPFSVTLANNNSSDLSVDFGFIPAPAGSIGDYLWMDLDGDGIQDSSVNEPGIPGAVVELYQDNVLKGTQTTGTDGYYLFTELSAGTYTVKVASTQTIGGYVYAPTTANAADSANDSNGIPNGDNTAIVATVTLPLNTSVDTSIDFGYSPVAASRIGDFVWNDLNDNGIQDPGEPGIDGVTVTLKSGTDVVATTVTSGGGAYSFIKLLAGNYSVEVDPSTLPAGFIPTRVTTAGVNPNVLSVTLPSNTFTDNSLDFGYVVPRGSIGDFIWKDTNQNGIQDAGEPGIAGVSVILIDSDGNPVGTPKITSSTGAYSFGGLRKGTYTVVVNETTLPQTTPGYLPTVATASGSNEANDSNGSSAPVIVTLASNIATDDTIDFGYIVPCSSIGNFVWKDSNQNGLQDAGEPGINGVTVKLYLVTAPDVQQLVGTTLTAGNGAYLFSGLQAGTYKVSLSDGNATALSSLIPTTPNSAAGNANNDSSTTPVTVVLAANNSTDTSVDFGFIPTPAGSIGDSVWNDSDGNGIHGALENGISGVTVRLYGSGSTTVPIRTVVTGTSGNYLFTGLAAGSYTVVLDTTSAALAGFMPTVIGAAGSDSTTDSNANNSVVTLGTNSSSNLTIDFGYFKPAPLTLTCPANTGITGTSYSSGPIASGGVKPYRFALASGTLPTGLTLNTTTGAITGTPTVAGSYNFAIRVTDAVGVTATSSDSGCCGGGTVTWTFNSPSGVLGNSRAYTVNGISVTAYGFSSTGSSRALYGRNQGGDLNGLGIYGSNCDNEIDTCTFVQLDLANLIAAGGSNIQMLVNSVQSTTSYNVYGSNTLGNIGTLLGASNRTLGNTFFTIPSVPTYRYVSLRASRCELLLGAISYSLADGCRIAVTPPPCTGTIGDLVWKDTNRNGIQDAGEPGICGVTVKLFGANNALIATKVTTSNGSYLFTGLGAGTYTVSVVSSSSALNGLTSTTINASGSTVSNDSNANPASVILASNSASNLTIDFGYRTPTCYRPCTTYNKCNWGAKPSSGWDSRCGYDDGRCDDYRTCDRDDDREGDHNNDRDCDDDRDRSYCFSRYDRDQGCLAKNFSKVYPNGLKVGGACSLTFTCAKAVENFLPTSGTSCAIRQQYVNPTVRLGAFAGQVVTLRIGVDFSNAAITGSGLSSYKLKTGKCAGKTVGQLLTLCESVLGGAPLPSGISCSDLSAACAVVNDNFDGGRNCGNLYR